MRLACCIALVALASSSCNCSRDPTQSSVPASDVQPLALDFGAVPVGLEAVLPLRVRNPGKLDLAVESVTAEDPAFYAVNPPTTVAAGETVSFDVAFKPQTEGALTAILHLRSNAPTNPDARVTLLGTGVGRFVCGDCTSPPPPYCTTDTTLVAYKPAGVCVAGKCQYEAYLVACPGGCQRQTAECVGGDAGVHDAGSTDAGGTDAGATDAGGPDAGSPDAGGPDAGVPDAGVDAGVPDAGVPDAGHPCTSGGVSPELAALTGGPYQNCQGGTMPRVDIQSNTRAWSGCCGDLARTCAVTGYSTQNTLYCL